MHYDTKAKCYVAEARFRPVFGPPDVAMLLQQEADSQGPSSDLPRLTRPIDAELVARLHRAARQQLRIDVLYQSFTRPEPTRRWIAPRRFVSDGDRWHLRAWCFRELEWRDFVLSRVIEAGAAEPAGELPGDRAWNETLELVLVPAPGLPESHRASIAREFGMTRGRLAVRIRAAMRFYAIRHWGLDRPDSRLAIAVERVVG
jgi:predicted DNA-binding transcriptional regulator YafY